MEQHPDWWRWLLVTVVVLMLGLPVMAGLCVWQAAVARRAGDEALSRSWADAAKSFAGMMVSSWLLLALARWAFVTGMEYLSRFQNG